METRKRSSLCYAYRDRLSNLPEPLIHHVLSFMDMKYVTRTTILSRRWRNLWYSLPFLSFDADVFQSCLMHASEDYRYKEFSDFVYMVLLVRDGSPIQSIHLSLKDLSSKLIHIDQWIRTAVLRNVKEIHVELDFKVAICELLVDLPDCLVTSKSLTSLKLCLLDEPCHYTMQVKLADKICLPALKTLHMELLDLSAYDNFFDVLFLGCPALETLVMVKCEFTVSKVLTISSLHLKHLLIDLNYGGNESLEIFVIHASNLLEYCWKGTSRSAFSLVGLSSLETANIDHGECYDVSNCKKLLPIDAENAKSMMECLKGLYNVKHLTLSNDCLQLISELPSELEKWPTVFSNLRFLNLQTWLTRGCFEVTMFLLKNSPNIETLVLHMDPIVSEETCELGVQSSSDLKLHHLKVVKLLEVGGCKNELQHMRIILGNAEALEKITIVKSRLRVNDSNEWKVFTAEVLTLPRASPDVRIIIQDTTKTDSYHCTSIGH